MSLSDLVAIEVLEANDPGMREGYTEEEFFRFLTEDDEDLALYEADCRRSFERDLRGIYA